MARRERRMFGMSVRDGRGALSATSARPAANDTYLPAAPFLPMIPLCQRYALLPTNDTFLPTVHTSANDILLLTVLFWQRPSLQATLFVSKSSCEQILCWGHGTPFCQPRLSVSDTFLPTSLSVSKSFANNTLLPTIPFCRRYPSVKDTLMPTTPLYQ